VKSGIFSFKLDEKRQKINITIADSYTFSSLVLHVGGSLEREKDKLTTFGTTRLTLSFSVDFRTDGYKFYKQQTLKQNGRY
jgi:hypothetical protein